LFSLSSLFFYHRLVAARSVEVSVLDFETHVLDSTLTEAPRFRQKRLTELSATVPSSKFGGIVDSHATSNPAISNQNRGDGLKPNVIQMSTHEL